MKSLKEFKELPYAEKFGLMNAIFGELAKHYDYFKDLHMYMLDHEAEINDEFLDVSYDIAFRLHEKLVK